MADRDVIKALDATRITTTSTSYVAALTATGTPTNGSKDFWVLASGIIDTDQATRDAKGQLYDSTGAATLAEWNVEEHDTTDRMPVFALAAWTSPVSPVSQSFTLDIATEVTGTVGLSEMCIYAIESHADDEYIGTDGEITTTSATYQDAQDLTFTPATAGDYLIIGYAECKNSSLLTGGVKLLIDGVDSFEVSPYESNDTTNYVPFMAVNKVNLTAASHTIKIQYTSNGSATAAIRRRRVLAIRLDTLRSISSDFTAARGTTTSTTAVDAASTTFTAEASVDYLAIGNAVLDGNSTSISVNAQISMDGAVVSLYTVEPRSTTSERVFAAMSYSTFAAGSRVIKTQVFSETAALTTGYSDRGIYVLDLREATVVGPTYTLDSNAGSFDITGVNAALASARLVNATAGSFGTTGHDASLARTLVILASAGSLDITGHDASLVRTLVVLASAGSFDINEWNSALVVSRLLIGNSGYFDITGHDAVLSKLRILIASTASFDVNGQDAALAVSRLLLGDAGSFDITGHDAVLSKLLILLASAASFGISSHDAGILASRLLLGSVGSFDITGQDASLSRLLTLIASAGSFDTTGNDAILSAARLILASAGSLDLTGNDAVLNAARLILANASSVNVTGNNSSLLASRLLNGLQGSLTVTDYDAVLTYIRNALKVVYARITAAPYTIALLASEPSVNAATSAVPTVNSEVDVLPSVDVEVTAVPAVNAATDAKPASNASIDLRPISSGV